MHNLNSTDKFLIVMFIFDVLIFKVLAWIFPNQIGGLLYGDSINCSLSNYQKGWIPYIDCFNVVSGKENYFAGFLVSVLPTLVPIVLIGIFDIISNNKKS